MIDLRVGEIGLRLTELERSLREILAARDEAERECRDCVCQVEQDVGGRLKALQTDLDAAREEREADHARFRDQILDVFRGRLARIDGALSGCLAENRAQSRRAMDRQEEELRKEKEKVAEQIHRKADVSAESLASLSTRIAPLRSAGDGLRERIRRFAAGRGVQFPRGDEEQIPDEEQPCSDLDEAVDALAEELGRTRRGLSAIQRSIPALLSGRGSLALIYLAVLLVHGAAAALAVHRSWDSFSFAGIGLALIAFLWLLRRASRWAVRRVAAAVNRPWEDICLGLRHLDRLEAAADKRLGRSQYTDEQIGLIMVLERKAAKRREETLGASAKEKARLRERHRRLRDGIERQRDEDLGRIETGHQGRMSRIKDAHGRKIQELEKMRETRTGEASGRRDQTIARLIADWRERLDGFRRFCEEAMRRFREAQAAGSEGTEESPHLPDAFPQRVFVDAVRLDLTQLDVPYDDDERFPLPGERTVTLPLALSFPTCGSLLVQAGSPGRARALEILLGSVLHLLRSFPAGRIKLTLIDPVGLGESFAGLMQLAEYDDTLVRGRIWTEPHHIERKLADLTEHIEKVIQNYLRNRYATIADYNEEAGQMTEPYEFAVIADFPTGFSDLALERLASVLTSGPRCGVYTLIHRDAGLKLPEETDPLRALRGALVLRDEGAGPVLDHEGLRKGTLIGEPPPKGEAMAKLLDGIGQRSAEAQQVELTFETVVPRPDEVWSLCAEDGIRVPIGRSGADRIQYLDLGRGTAQHALVGGRTGSGKSTLFHVIITATALWFRPQEVEFYLIDFKHGVEFKPFATHRLPHARVIAIESDREFGLSVLQKVNEELSRRGDLFRKAGVQDLAGYRRSSPKEQLPRTLLLIDEFQEFFTEDDVIARDAALLLDRFVRQGRAFGIHIILGSQTLSGIYTLAKSTLGQMGVRIALQCNEADSHLILSEDNGAARLLSHPGEAIYNDMSGLIEGNSPFQVVWLPEDAEEVHLRQLRAQAEEKGERGAGRMIVFEGNAPADLGDNPLLGKLLEKGTLPGGAAGRAWVGEASAIKGPTEVRFARAGGSNLLIVGQNREAAFATLEAMFIGLAAGHGAEDARFIVFDGEGRASEHAAHLSRLVQIIGPSRLLVPGLKGVGGVLQEVNEAIASAGDEDEQSPRRTYVVAFGLQRLRMLRHEETFSLAADAEEASSPGEHFANLLREGPEHGVHCIVWCDTLANLSRALPRSALRAFDMRILFQMSPADSSEMTDSTAASQLGLHKALLAVESDGTLEKFRPYTLPRPEILEELHGLLGK